MSAFNSQDVHASNSDVKSQTASRRAASLREDRADYGRRTSLSCNGRSLSAAPRGSDFAAPHRAARAAKRSLLAKGALAASADVPQISMGREGTWSRWIRKPSVAKASNQAIEDWDTENVIEAAEAQGVQGAESGSPWHEDERDCHSTEEMRIDLSDETAFPALSPVQAKMEPKVVRSGQEAEVADEPAEALSTPEKLPQLITNMQSSIDEVVDEATNDWVIVPAGATSKADSIVHAVARTEFDGQHPRNAFAKKTKQNVCKQDSNEAGGGMDWSQGGMPTAFIKRLLLGGQNASHRSPYSEKKDTGVPLQVLRAQSNGSSKRERSNSAPRTPRSQSKPRAIKQPQSRR